MTSGNKFSNKSSANPTTEQAMASITLESSNEVNRLIPFSPPASIARQSLKNIMKSHSLVGSTLSMGGSAQELPNQETTFAQSRWDSNLCASFTTDDDFYSSAKQKAGQGLQRSNACHAPHVTVEQDLIPHTASWTIQAKIQRALLCMLSDICLRYCSMRLMLINSLIRQGISEQIIFPVVCFNMQ
jgi:hypothetical protein